MERLRSLRLCGSGGDQTTSQLNEVAHMYADRFMENSRCFQSTLWEYLGQRLWRYKVSKHIFGSSSFKSFLYCLHINQNCLVYCVPCRFVLQGSLINKIFLPSNVMLQRLSCTSSVLRQFIGKIERLKLNDFTLFFTLLMHQLWFLILLQMILKSSFEKHSVIFFKK